MNFLFLYTELADYFINCCKTLSSHGTVHIVRWPVNKEAPFKFEFPANVRVYDKADYNLQQLSQLILKINPGIIICSGWIDKDYLQLVKPWYKKIPTVLACDTHWRGSLKQYVAAALSRVFLLTKFSHAWVPGEAQYKYVRKLGFKPAKISRGFYCCDLEKFNSVYLEDKPAKQQNLPHRFIFTGRYYDFKGITDLWEAFIQLHAEHPNDWELWCLGTGSVEPVQHPKIKHFGFVQPAELHPVLKQCSVFILPSRFEPWGVVAQEYAAAGFPLLLSTEVGAGEVFLEENKNGFRFEKENVLQIKNSLKKIISLDNNQLLQMCEHSHQLAQKITPQGWAQTILNILNGSAK
jgi:glycosyltransferase involved in cell wall biosynthesis